jgi:hypothetical protein
MLLGLVPEQVVLSPLCDVCVISFQQKNTGLYQEPLSGKSRLKLV